MSTEPRFPGQLQNERVIIYTRRHWFTLIKWIWWPLVFLLICVLIAWGMTSLLRPSSVSSRALFWLLLPAPALVWLVWKALDWANDRYIVTNKRVIHRERVYFFFESKKEAYLDKIQDVTIKIASPLANLFNFGDVVIQTAAGTEGAINFRSVSKPRDIQRLILASAGLPQKEQQSTPSPQYSWKGVWWMLYPLYPAEEEDMIIWRKHWWVLHSELFLPLMAGFVLTVIWLWALTSLSYPGWVNALFALGLTVVGLWIAFRLIDWHNDLYIMTSDRVIDIEKRPFVMEHRREASLGAIQDVSLEQKGFVAKALDFGDVRLKTAGKLGEFTFDSVPHPQKVQAEIMERLNAFRQKKKQEEKEKQRTEIISIVEEYLRQTGAGLHGGLEDKGKSRD